MHMITKELIQDAEAENIKVQVPFIARSLRLLAGVAACQGDDAVACVLYEESLAIAGELDYKWYIAACLEDLARVAATQGQPAYAARLWHMAESLRGRAQAFGFDDKIGQILIPTEEVVELRGGKKVTSKRLVYPGYVLVEMEMNDELWHAVKATPRVTGFVGGGNAPVPLTADEVNSILYRQATAAERPRPKLSFEKNENVRIIDGPFTNFSGKIDEVHPERNTLRVMVTIFGRSTPVELDFLQVEKI